MRFGHQRIIAIIGANVKNCEEDVLIADPH